MPIDPRMVKWDDAPVEQAAPPRGPAIDPRMVKWEDVPTQPASRGFAGGVGDVLAGAVRGAGSIGATIVDQLRSKLADPVSQAIPENMRPRVTMGLQDAPRGDALRTGMDGGLAALGARPDSWLYKGGKLAGEVAGTAGVGGVLAKPLQAMAATRFGAGIEPILNGAAQALQTGGFRVGDLAGTGAGVAARALGGAAVGGATAGMVNPEDAGVGALIGGALPLAAQGAGKLGGAIRRSVAGDGAAPEVVALARRAQELGINLPADRLTNSRPMNAVASSLNYMPFSGRAATEDAMNSQLNQALSRTFGQDSPNVTKALRDAAPKLGGEFDRVLRGNTVQVDQQFIQELAESANRASRELGTDGASIIGKQVDDIIAKAGTGQIDGQAAYNIKKTLDRIGNRNTPEAFYAGDLKKSLMGALNRSLGPEQASAFAKTRQQYGAMLDLEKLAKNGAEGEVSVARLANMRGINNPQMQELADIAAQFVRPREGAHGAAQRVVLGTGATLAGAAGGGLLGGAVALPAAALVGRGMNGLLNSNAARNFVLQPQMLGEVAPMGLLTDGFRRTAPLLGTQSP